MKRTCLAFVFAGKRVLARCENGKGNFIFEDVINSCRRCGESSFEEFVTKVEPFVAVPRI